ncbi:MAG TPA: condensation domain-containing protein, partial [Clostridia bacterium]|nr:condensation domain-containing protein [Clostridia bacterium]
KDFLALYKGMYLSGLNVQYKDFVVWRNNLLKSDAVTKEGEYWLSRFSGNLPVLDLPTDYPRPPVQSFKGDRLLIKVENVLAESVKNLAGEMSTTPYVVLLAAYSVLLSKYSGQEDIIIGSVVAGRYNMDLENMMGLLANTIVFRSFPNQEKTFRDIVKELKENVLKALEDQTFQFELLVDRLNLKRDISRNFLFDVGFALHKTMDDIDFNIDGIRVEPYDFDQKMCKYDLNLEVIESKSELTLNMEYCSELYKKSTVEMMMNDYQKILDFICKDKDMKISEIELESHYLKKEEALIEDFEFNF